MIFQPQSIGIPVQVPISSPLNFSLNQPNDRLQNSRNVDQKVDGLRCHFCKVTTSPEWRKGPMGRNTLCNACGLAYAKMIKRTGGAAVTAPEIEQLTTQRRRTNDLRRSLINRQCAFCGTSEAPVYRKGPYNKFLCNKHGLEFNNAKINLNSSNPAIKLRVFQSPIRECPRLQNINSCWCHHCLSSDLVDGYRSKDDSVVLCRPCLIKEVQQNPKDTCTTNNAPPAPLAENTSQVKMNIHFLCNPLQK